MTVAFAARRGFPWKKVIPYSIAQVLHAFSGAALIFANYHDAIKAHETAANIVRGDPSGNTTFSIFATFPAPYFNGGWIEPLLDQVIGTAFLALLILAVVDVLNTAPEGNIEPYMIGLIVVAIGISFVANAGYAINPARDFGPRVLAWLAGWGLKAFPGVDNYFWIPIVCPLIVVVGAYVYNFRIHDVLVARGGTPIPDVEEVGRTVVEDSTVTAGWRERRCMS